MLRISRNPRKRKQEVAALRPAAQNKRSKAPAAADKQQAASSDSSDSSSTEEEEEAPSEQGAKSERFFTPGDKLGSPASDGTPATAPAEVGHAPAPSVPRARTPLGTHRNSQIHFCRAG